MSIFKMFAKLFLASLVLMSFSCEKEEEKKPDQNKFPPVNKGDVEVDEMSVALSQRGSSSIDTFFYKNNSNPKDTLNFISSASYELNVEFFYQGDNVTDEIESNYKDYVVCYRDYNRTSLELDSLSKDIEGFNFGLYTRWTAVDVISSDELRVTLKFQQLRKENLCEPGVQIFDINIPYLVKN